MIAMSLGVLSSAAHATVDKREKACEVARRTVAHYTIANKNELYARMDALSSELMAAHSPDSDDVSTAIMSFLAQADTPEGKPILQEFISDVCNDDH